MTRRPLAYVALASLAVSGCGGGGGSGSVVTPAPTAATPVVTPTPTLATAAAAGCSLRERQDWAAAQLREWYLFPDTLPAGLDPAPYTTVGDYIDALTATARAQRKDRYFTYLTSIAGEDAYYTTGSSAGFGFRVSTSTAQRRVFISETFEGTPALAAGIDRGAELIAIGTTAANLRPVSDIVAAEGSAGVTAALGPSTAGTTRLLRVAIAGTTRDVSVTKADYELTPVSARYGSRIIDEGGRRYGYLNLRTFISTADAPLRAAFVDFRAQGITDIVVDLRYNGGGLVSIAELVTDLLGRDRTTGDVASYTSFRPEKSSNNRTRYFSAQPQSVAPTRLAFIGTSGTASASELVINAQIPYRHAAAALVGANTYGKPVGQIALDKAACDDRLRVIAFATENSAHQGAYYDGLAGKVEASCTAADDVAHPLGDPQESSTRAALDFLAGRSCAPIGAASLTQAARDSRRELLIPDRPTTAQRETPGLF